MFCSFSPCIEQVQRCAAVLSEQHFGDIETIECLLRPFDVRTVELQKVVMSTSNNSSDDTGSNLNDTSSSDCNTQLLKRKRETFKHPQVLITRPHTDIRGHTGYLTFARKLDDVVGE